MYDDSTRVARVPLILIGVLLLLAGLPMVIAALGDPLVPPELAQTATAFAPTAMAHQTREAEEEYNRPSVIVTLPPDEWDDTTNKRIIELAAVLQATPTATIPIPRMITATPLPPSEKTLTITAQEAEQSIAADIEEINNPRVTFIAPDQLIIRGQVRTQVLFGNVTGELVILGRLEQRATQLYVTVTRLSLNGVEITDSERRNTAESLVNAWIRRRYLLNRDVLSFRIEDNAVIMQVLEYSGNRLPTPLPSPTATSTATSDAPTSTPIVPLLSTPTPTPAGAASGRILTDETATQLARAALPFVRDPKVRFTLDGIEITGKIALSLSPLAPEVTTPFRFVGTLGIENGQLTVTPKVLEISLVEVARTGIGQQLMEAIQTWLRSALASGPVVSFELQGGRLIINLAELR